MPSDSAAGVGWDWVRAFFSCMAWRAIPGPLSKRKRRLDSLEAAQGATRAPRRDSRGERSPWLPLETRPESPGVPPIPPSIRVVSNESTRRMRWPKYWSFSFTLQCSCLENPRDGGAWWAAVYGVAQSRTRLKQLMQYPRLRAVE